MSRIIHLDGVGKERNRLTKAIIVAIRELMSQSQVDQKTCDLAAFITLALEEIYQTIDISVEAWEKRGYWVKADQFRMEWSWTQKYSLLLREALHSEEWATVAMITVQVAEKLKKVKAPQRNNLGEPWLGAWEKLQKSNS